MSHNQSINQSTEEGRRTVTEDAGTAVKKDRACGRSVWPKIQSTLPAQYHPRHNALCQGTTLCDEDLLVGGALLGLG